MDTVENAAMNNTIEFKIAELSLTSKDNSSHDLGAELSAHLTRNEEPDTVEAVQTTDGQAEYREVIDARTTYLSHGSGDKIHPYYNSPYYSAYLNQSYYNSPYYSDYYMEGTFPYIGGLMEGLVLPTGDGRASGATAHPYYDRSHVDPIIRGG
jgi:hypothetical protein